MGQGCSGSVADAIAEVQGQETGSSNAAAQVGNGNSKNSTIWRHQNARRIEELTFNLTREEFRTLLELFRGKCRLERSVLQTSTATVPSHGNKAASPPTINLGWKRIALTDEALFSLFPSVSAANISCVLGCLKVTLQRQLQTIQSNLTGDPTTLHNTDNEDPSSATNALAIPSLRLVTKAQLMRAFHCSAYLYNPRDSVDSSNSNTNNNNSESYTANSLERGNSITPALQSTSSVPALGASSRALSTASVQSNGTSTAAGGAGTAAQHGSAVVQHQELLFRDFCFALSLCRHGNMAEQLTFLFVLFAEPVSAGATDNNTVTATGGGTQSIAPSRANSSKLALSAQTASASSQVAAATANTTVPTAASASGDTDLNSSEAAESAAAVKQDGGNNNTAHEPSAGASEPPTTAGNDASAVPIPTNINASASASASAIPKAPLTAQNSTNTVVASPPPLKSRGFSFFSPAKAAVVEKTQLQMLGLSEAGALKMWLFVQLQLLRVAHPALSLAFSALVTAGCAGATGGSGTVYDVLQSILSTGWLDNHTLDTTVLQQILQNAERLVAIQQPNYTADNSNNISGGGNGYGKATLTHTEFLQLCRAEKTVDSDTADASGNSCSRIQTGSTNSVFALLCSDSLLCAENVRCVLQELASDVLPSAQQLLQVQGLGQRYFSASRAQTDLQKCLSILHTDQPVPAGVRSDFAVFALDARWFNAWCHSTRLTPAFYTPSPAPALQPTAALTALMSSPARSKRRPKTRAKAPATAECLKHLVVNLLPLSAVAGTSGLSVTGGNSSVTGGDNAAPAAPAAPVNKENKVPDLHNSCLLSKDAVGVLRLRDTDQVTPFTSTRPTDAETSANTVPYKQQYVFVPYELGRQLYLRFDVQSSVIPATAYRRYLRFASNARPIEPVRDTNASTTGTGNRSQDALQALGTTATQLIHNFNATLEAQCDPHPVTVPLFLCTPLGTATAAPVDTLQVSVLPPTVAGADRVCVLHSVHNMFPAGADLCEPVVIAVSLQDLVRNTLSALDTSLTPAEDLTQSCRVWGLYASQGGEDGAESKAPTVQHSVGTVWRLLTADASQYGAALSDVLSPRSTKQAASKGSRSADTSASSVCLGFMIERVLSNTTAPATAPATATDGPRLWPTDRILAAQGKARAGAGSSSVAETCPFKIAERVDMLTDTNKWVVGVVTNIAREQSPVTGAVKVQVTVRQLLDGDAPAALLAPLEKPSQSVAEPSGSVSVQEPQPLDDAQSVLTDSVAEMPAAATATGSTAVAPTVTPPAAPLRATAPASAGFKRPKVNAEAPEESTEPQLNPENELNGEESDRGEGSEEQGGDDNSDAESAVGDNERVNPALQEAINKNKALEAKRLALEQADSVEDSAEGSDDGESYEDESSTTSPTPLNKTAASKAGPSAALPATAEDLQRIEAEAVRAANTHSGVTWDTAQAKARLDLSITVPHSSLRILNLGTMTSPQLTAKPAEVKVASKGLAIGTTELSSDSTQQYAELLVSLRKHMQEFAVAHQSSRDTHNAAISRAVSALSGGDGLPRQGSVLSPGKKAPSAGNVLTHRASFFGTRSSVIPMSNDDPRYEQNGDAAQLDNASLAGSVHSGADGPGDLSRAGSLVSSVVDISQQSADGGVSPAEWKHLQLCMKSANTCPFRLRVLYLLVLSERLMLLERGHPHKGTVVLQNRVYDANLYLTPLPSTAPSDVIAADHAESSAAPNSHRSDDRSYTEHRAPNAANVVQSRPKQRNAFDKFLKSCGKSLQHGLIPKQHHNTVPASGVAAELANADHNDTSNSNSNSNNSETEAQPADTSAGANVSGVSGAAESSIGSGQNKRTAPSPGHAGFHGHTARPPLVPTMAHPPVSAFPQQAYGQRKSIAAIAKGQAGAQNSANGVRLLGVAGLNNLGNTCFMSAALQCLFRTTPLVNYFLSQQYRYDINARSNLGSKGKLTEEFAKFLQTIYSMGPIPVSSLKTRKISAAAKPAAPNHANTSNNTSPQPAASVQRHLVYSNLSPTTLLKAFQAHKPQFSGADQQDSQEFLCELLDTFHEDLKLPPALSTSSTSRPVADSTVAAVAPAADASVNSGGGGVGVSVVVPTEGGAAAATTGVAGDADKSQAAGGGSVAANSTTTNANSAPVLVPVPVAAVPQLSVQQQGEQRWARYLETNTSIVTNLFQGQMCSKIVCKVCNTSSANFEPFTTLSMPIPRLRSDSVSQSDLTTVIVTVYRKMPRLSQILRLPDECFEGGVLTQEQVLELYRANRNPVKIALQFPRFATIENVLAKAVELYNAYEADAVSNADHNSSAFNSTVGTPVTRNAGTAGGTGNGARSFADDLSAGNSYQDLDSTAQSLNGDNSIAHDVNGASAAADTSEPPASAADAVSAVHAPAAPELGEAATVVTYNTGNTGNGTARSPAQSPPLVIANAIVIDVNDKRKGRFGKMLDRRDQLQALLDEATNECHLILQERCKDITFVASLQASRLSLDYERSLKLAHRQKSTYFTSLLDYTDASEYDAGHVLYNNFPTLEGPILADFDRVYDPVTYPGRSDQSIGSLSTFLRTEAEAEDLRAAAAGTNAAVPKNAPRPPKIDAAKEAMAKLAAQPPPDYSFRNAKPWPQNLFDFQIGDRVDAVDYKGTWYPGSVIDILVLSERDIKSHALTRYCRDFIRKDGGVQGASNSKEACAAGLHVKVHFDGFKCNWDEWYDQRDFDRGFVAPVYTKTSRKLKMHEIPIIQRRLVYTTQGNAYDDQPEPPSTAAGNGTKGVRSATPVTPATPQSPPLCTLNIEILDCPSFVQGESYRSCAHLYTHVHEQMLRYVDEDLLLQTVERPIGDENSPFSIRLLSFDNLLMAPSDHHCPVVTTALRHSGPGNGAAGSAGVGEVRSEVVLGNTSAGVEFSVADRFNGHKNWEGCAMPMDIARPIVNIYHNKLAIAVDWFVHVDLPPPPLPSAGNAGNAVNAGNAGNGAEALIVDTSTPVTSSIAAGLLHEAMLYRHDVTYQNYLNAQRQRLVTAQQAAARLREQQQRDEQLRRQAALAANATANTSGTANGGAGTVATAGVSGGNGDNGNSGSGAGLSAEDTMLLAYTNDARNGLTIEDVLSKFVRSEDIDEYYCNHCRRPTPGKLHSSIHTLPDVLILHLQRLVITSNGGGKIRTLVKFPLSQLNMRPFTTEQKEYVASLADLAADCIDSNNGSGNGNHSSAGADQRDNNTDLYELYGVVNHMGGMNGGHYTALSKCEEVVLQDLAAQRYQRTTGQGSGAGPDSDTAATMAPAGAGACVGAGATTGASAGPSNAAADYLDDSVGETVEQGRHANRSVNPLSMTEFITGTLAHATAGSSNTNNVGVSGGAADCVVGGCGKGKWLKYDDEFVNVVPAANLHNSVVTESAFLLFYQRKQLTDSNLARYL